MQLGPTAVVGAGLETDGQKAADRRDVHGGEGVDVSKYVREEIRLRVLIALYV